MSGDDVALRFDGAGHTYRSGPGIGPLSFSVRYGDVVGLIGANGSGKSTLLQMATGLRRVTQGRVYAEDVPVRFGVLPAGCAALIEAPVFFRGLSGRANLELACSGRRVELDLISETLERVGLDPDDRRRLAEYSQGMAQRLGIARTLLASPRLLILDEPTNGLDPDGFSWLRLLVGELAGAGVAILISSHVLSELEPIATHALVLNRGKLVASGDIGELRLGYGTLEDLYFRVSDKPT